MRHKLALIIALAGFAVVDRARRRHRRGRPGDRPRRRGADRPAASATPIPAAAAACANGLDDDDDGLADLEDPDCERPEGRQRGAGRRPKGQPGAGARRPSRRTASQARASRARRGEADAAGKAVKRNADPRRAAAAPGSTRRRGHRPGRHRRRPAAGRAAPTAAPATATAARPTGANPTTTIAPFGPAPIGVPNFVIDSFEIPPFLLPIYQACGTEYGIPWEVLASINKIETAFGTNLNVSSAGAMGWMQFLPSSWETYGLDANGDGRKDPYNPVDAICAAAHYLKVAGGSENLYDAIFAYNHADWYVQEVLLYARAYGKLPADLVGSLTGLTEGAHFPIAADARYADDISARAALSARARRARRSYGNAAEVISSSPTRRGINIFAAEGAPVVAVNDGVIGKLGHSREARQASSSSRTPTATATPTRELGELVRERAPGGEADRRGASGSRSTARTPRPRLRRAARPRRRRPRQRDRPRRGRPRGRDRTPTGTEGRARR